MSEDQTTSEAQTMTDEVQGQEPQIQQQAEPQAKPTQEQIKQIEKNIQKFKLKVDGEEIEADLDLNDREAIIKELQMSRVAKKRMAEAQESKRKVYEIAQLLENPTELLKRHPKGYETAEQLLLEKLQNEMMSPEEKKLRDYEQKIKKYEEQERLLKKQQEHEQQKALEHKHAEHYQKVIIEALDKSGLPKTPEMAKRAAYLLQKNLELGLDLDANDLVGELKADVVQMIKSLTNNAEIGQLLELLGQDIPKKIRKHDIENLKKKQPGYKDTKPIYQGSGDTHKPKKQMSFDEWQKLTEERVKGLAD